MKRPSPSTDPSDPSDQSSDDGEVGAKRKRMKRPPPPTDYSDPGSDDGEAGAKRKRMKRPCPSCGTFVIHLPRHLKCVHKWQPDRARRATILYGLKKPYSNRKDYHHPKVCPVENCFSVVKRMCKHLQQVHKIKKTSAQYYSALNQAKLFKPKMPNVKTEAVKKVNTVKNESVVDDKDFIDLTREKEDMESVTVSDDYASSEEDIEVTGEISELFDLFAKWLQSTDGGNLVPRARDTSGLRRRTRALA
jgi:hypothetical protein